jgi:hypothetical protein
MLEYWQYYPPVNESCAAFMGIKEPQKIVQINVDEFKIIPE